MILLRENPFWGHWKGWAMKIKTFLGPEMAPNEASSIWAQKSKHHIKNRYIGNFMHMSFAAAVWCWLIHFEG